MYHAVARSTMQGSVVLFVGLLIGTLSAAAPPQQPAASDADSHLAACWNFEETEGTSAADSSANGRNGTLCGGLSFATHSVPGVVGRALRLEGGENRVEVVGYKGVGGTAPRTIALWIKAERGAGQIVSWGTADFGRMWILGFIRGHLGVTPHGGYYYMAARVDDGQWHHVAVVLRQAEEPNLHDHVTLYLDGKIAEIDKIGLLDLWPIDTGAEQDVTIGRGFHGAIDQLRIYDRALSMEEIQTLYSTRK